MHNTRPRGGILVLDMSYTLSMFQDRQLQQALDSRDVGGFFDRVVSVHPLAGLFEPESDRFGVPRLRRVSDTHVFIEGRVGRYRRLAFVPPLNFIVAQVSLVRLLIRESRASKVVVVRAGDPYYLGLLGWLLARWLGVPLATRVPFRYDEIRRITGRAVFPRLFRFGWVEKRIERFVFPRCDLIAGANEDNMRYALENGGRPATATVFRYGNLLDAVHWEEPSRRPGAQRELEELGLAQTTFIVTVARLEPMKRVEDTIRTLAALTARGLAVKALIIGEGSSRVQLESFARSHGVESAIVFAGNRTQGWIARVLPHAAVIVSPHMGRALVEAALSGVPIVAFDYDWQREVVIDDETGYLVANGDWQAMADRTARLLAAPGRAREMGKNARAKMSAMMAPATLIRHEQATYERLLTARDDEAAGLKSEHVGA
jgi:glycosyltransferase involved in cell wall biosynthesis